MHIDQDAQRNRFDVKHEKLSHLSMTSLTSLGVGLGLKPQFFEEALDAHAEGLWWEVHPENYMVEGGPRLSWLHAIRQKHPVSFHSVSLSLGSACLPDAQQVARLRTLVDRYEPALVSEHLAWSVWQGQYFPDLLPVQRDAETLSHLVRNIQYVQEALGRTIAIENPSHYLAFSEPDGEHTWDEIDFLTELHCRSGCQLLVDVNNIAVSANNLGFDAIQHIDRWPADAIAEIHLAGHSLDPAWGEALWIDSHDQPISAQVWFLYERLIARIGQRPTLIERDDNLPTFDTLMQERLCAHQLLSTANGLTHHD